MKKNYGVWGLGVVGKSVLQFLHSHSHHYAINKLMVMDKRTPTPDETTFLKKLNIEYINQTDQNRFFTSADHIIPSPGIDIREADSYKEKMIEEIDLFFDAWQKPLIAVTGTLGKTSVVHLLSRILEHNGIKLATGGNIGTGMLDLISQKAQYGLLELSSFQLERAKRFAPDIAILTNLYPNHLDRHGTMDEYLQAKYRIMIHQKNDQKALVPWALRKELRSLSSRPFHFFSTQISDSSNPSSINFDPKELHPTDILYTLNNQEVRKITHTSNELIFNTQNLPALSYNENWLILLAACDMLGVLNQTTFTIPALDLPHHRLEKVGTARGITFYNDSKSTIPEATVAAIQYISPARIHLFLGGLSKGVDRASNMGSFKDKVASIICFGAEADTLYNACIQAAIPAQKYVHLEEAFKGCIEKAQPADLVLFSPAGSSWDFFKDYKERGDTFVKLVHALEQEQI